MVKLSWYFPGGSDVIHRDLSQERCISFGYSFRAAYRCVCTTESNTISKYANNFLCYPQSQHVAALKPVSIRFLQTRLFVRKYTNFTQFKLIYTKINPTYIIYIQTYATVKFRFTFMHFNLNWCTSCITKIPFARINNRIAGQPMMFEQ